MNSIGLKFSFKKAQKALWTSTHVIIGISFFNNVMCNLKYNYRGYLVLYILVLLYTHNNTTREIIEWAENLQSVNKLNNTII